MLSTSHLAAVSMFALKRVAGNICDYLGAREHSVTFISFHRLLSISVPVCNVVDIFYLTALESIKKVSFFLNYIRQLN